MADDDEDERETGPPNGAVISVQRVDKWLWHARVVKSRTLAATLVTEGKVRLNGEKIDKPSATVRAGDVVTTLLRQQVRILKVAGFATKRGSAVIAATLFDDLSPPPVPADPTSQANNPAAKREPGSGRPTKRERREIDRFKYGLE
jgi:ribosome-associated heat shock protein Hsp15